MNLRYYREQAEITQKQLEDLSGVKQVTISKLERGDSSIPTLAIARKIVLGLRKAGCKSVTIDQVFPSREESA